MNIILLDTIFNPTDQGDKRISLSITGALHGNILGNNIHDVCSQLASSNLATLQDKKIYINAAGYGVAVVSPNAVVPTYGSKCAAGMDLYSSDTYSIAPGETVLVHTGISMEIPDGYFGAIYPRSGLATKRGLRLANCVGVVDSDYRGEIIVALYNDSTETQSVELETTPLL